MNHKLRTRVFSVLMIFALVFGAFLGMMTVYKDNSVMTIYPKEAVRSGALGGESIEKESAIRPENSIVTEGGAARESASANTLSPSGSTVAAPLPSNQLAFQCIYSTQMKGEIKITGNTLHMPDSRYYTQKYIDSYGMTGAGGRGSSQNNDLYMGEYDADSDPSTRNSSADEIEVTGQARIHKAFLVWGGTTKAGDKTRTGSQVSGKTPQEEPQAAAEAEIAAGPVIKFKTPQMTG
ncbi:MAG: hypothetical protein SOR61_05345 [Evtepia sp.]|uniref:hypothetical protein n=1 Tax=Evtepia sp. TaxID=2773933 RepID=UPI002A752AAD|nr:hypothetical protein [Evtepia sp.]MDY3014604.1 hypothetical protein [Evtepia sp.]